MNTIESILTKIPKVRVTVVGDFTLDFYISIHTDRKELSVETGLPVLSVENFHVSPGGAGNVAANLIDIGVGSVRAFGVVGNDMFGRELLEKLSSKKIDISCIHTQKVTWDTHVYTKVIENGKEGSRIDFGTHNKLIEHTADLLIAQLEQAIEETDIVIVNQQLKSGLHTLYFRNLLTGIIRKHPDTVFITDSRDFPEVFEGTYRKINREEAGGVLDRAGIKIEKAYKTDTETARQLYTLWKQPVFLTRGEKGILVSDQTGIHEIQGIYITRKVDTVGAGDTCLSAIASALGAGFSPSEAAVLGNLAASVTVQKLHTTGTATKGEILALEGNASYLYNPDLAVHLNKAKLWRKTEIEIIQRPKAGWNYNYILFDHDGTLSTLRQGWEQIMEPMMLESIIGEASIESNLYESICRRVKDYINKTTGIRTLIQMKGLIELIKEYQLIPQSQILNEFEYKKIYNRQLMKVVRQRTEKFKRGELGIQDVTMKNAVLMLEELRKRGMEIFLASGTDQEDVNSEAEMLGYAHFFNGGIFGATRDIQNEPKKVVINTILQKIGRENGSEILTFGDGPVEIAQTKKVGGYTVGVASNEVQRYGLNPVKRARLIRAGADCIIPDYSQLSDFLNLLEGKGIT